MLDRAKHEITMRQMIDEIYSHPFLAGKLGFKGGTAGYFFYHLPRFSTDLDFNLLDLSAKQEVFVALGSLLAKFGEVKDRFIKQNTIFFLVAHTPGRSAIQVEISTREIEKINEYNLIEFYGTSVLVIKKADLLANKLIALTHRTGATARDLYDIHFFLSQNWSINGQIIQKLTGQKPTEYLAKLISFVRQKFNQRTVLQGLGELLADDTQRIFVKNKLIDQTVKMIEIYRDATA